MIRAEVKTVTMSRAGFVVLLEGVEDERVLPIHIGPPEAQSILLFLNDVPVARPLTHDLFRNVLESMAARIDRIVVNDLRQETFFATMSLTAGSDTLQVDCRPSDAIALALRCAAPIYIEESVMARAGIHLQDEDAEEGAGADEAPPQTEEDAAQHAATKDLSGEGLIKQLKAQLRKAVDEERYEDAAALRDRIGKMSSAAG
jgi:bifunctional DNase/RNase